MKTFAFITAGAALAVVGSAALPQPAEAQSRGAPRGSYTQSCSEAYVNQGRLYADCRDMRGNTRASSIELAPCSSSDIGNDNGLLVCHNVRGRYEGGGYGDGGWNGGGWNGGGHGGGWNGGNNGRASITVYRDANYRGGAQSYRGEVSNLGNSGINDSISSIEVRGVWEVCTDANFRGRCEIIDSDVSNLDRWGLNDRISSMRPARRGGW